MIGSSARSPGPARRLLHPVLLVAPLTCTFLAFGLSEEAAIPLLEIEPTVLDFGRLGTNEKKTMKLKIKCDGNPQNAVVVNAATDEIVENVLAVELSLSPFEIEAAIVIKNMELDLDNIEAEELNAGDTTRNDGG